MSEPTLYSETKRKARKSHICSGCGDTIAKGSEYCDIKGLWDGDFESYKLCSSCTKMYDLVRDNHAHEHYAIVNSGNFLAELREYDETACDLADMYKLPLDYVQKFIR